MYGHVLLSDQKFRRSGVQPLNDGHAKPKICCNGFKIVYSFACEACLVPEGRYLPLHTKFHFTKILKPATTNIAVRSNLIQMI